MSTTQKAITLAYTIQRDLKKRLAKLSTAVVVADVTFDSDQGPLITIGTGAVGAAGGTVKVTLADFPLSLNAINQQASLYGYSPNKAQFVREASVSANTLELTAAILATLAQRGLNTEYYESTNGTAPDSSQFIAANLKYTHVADSDFGAISGQ